MKPLSIITLFLMYSLFGEAISQGLQGTAELYRFQANDKPYVEIFFYVLGSTVTQQQIDTGQFKGGVELLYLIERTDREVAAGDKYNLLSPASEKPVDFMDIKRIALGPGDYILVVEYRDIADTANSLELNTPFTIPGIESAYSQSDIQLVSAYGRKNDGTGNFEKNGVFIQPLPYAFYHEGYDKLTFYHELYHTNLILEKDFYISYHVSTNDNTQEHLLTAHKKLSPADVNPILIDLDISNLSSGDYLLQVEVHRPDKELISQREVRFTRSNPEADQKYSENWQLDTRASFVQSLSAEQLEYSLRALQPIISSSENEVLNYLLKKGEDENKRFFLHRIWYGRNPEDPFAAFSKYMDVARWVDKKFAAAFGYGFEMDKGHIYLKYGQPDDMIGVEDEPSAPPYEIWIYYDFPKTNQSNVKFLFYNPSLAGNDFRLLHSTAIGELNNPRWEVQLYGDVPNEVIGDNHFDATRVEDNFHRNARYYFNDF